METSAVSPSSPPPCFCRDFFIDHPDWYNRRVKKRILHFRPNFMNTRLGENGWSPSPATDCVEAPLQSALEFLPAMTFLSEGSGPFSTSVSSSIREGNGALLLSSSLTATGSDTSFPTIAAESLLCSDELFLKLQQCIKDGDLTHGKNLHLQMINCGLHADAFLGSHLIRLLTHFNSLSEAYQVFLRVLNPSVYTWGAIILAHVSFGDNEKAFQLYHEMSKSSVVADGHIFVGALKTCTKASDLKNGISIHSHVVEHGLEFDDFVTSGLVEMYSKCGSPRDAQIVFDRMPRRGVITCSLLMAGYEHQGKEDIALQIFRTLLKENVQLDEVTCIYALKACTSNSVLEQGRQIHAYLIGSGFDLRICVGNALINMYIKCNSLQDANIMFHRLPVQDVITWTALISAYAQQGFGEKALRLFNIMQQRGIDPTPITLVLILRACSSVADVQQGRHFHACIIASGLELQEFAGSSLIDMYGKCGSLEEARILFERIPKPGVICWSAYIARIAENGSAKEACQLFEEMQHGGLVPDKVTFICILKACTRSVCLQHGRQIHQQVVENGFETDAYVGNALLDMYIKCEGLQEASVLSNRLPEHNVVTWSLLIGGYVQHGYALKALQFFFRISQEGMELDEISFLSALKACSKLAALTQGRHIHVKIIEKGFEYNEFLSSTLIDMYGKCGSLKDAHRTFERLPKQNVVIWSTLMTGYGQNGDYTSVLHCFENMLLEGLQPDDISFLSLLTACSHKGLVEKGRMHFKLMRDEHGIIPSIMHYNALVDVLGHAGYLKVVEDLLETIPCSANLVGWTSLLTSCRSHLNVDIGRRSFDCFCVIDHGNATGYVLMRSIYAQLGMHEEAGEIEELRKYANVWKKPGKAFIEIGDQVHDFIVGDRTHPETTAIYAKLESLNFKMKLEGYKPPVDLIMDNTSDDEKETALCGHCEKLAIAFGLISTEEGSTIRVSKNLRMCADCHNVTKMISKLEMRQIVVVDAYCTHNFQEGICSCQGSSIGKTSL